MLEFTLQSKYISVVEEISWRGIVALRDIRTLIILPMKNWQLVAHS